MQQSKQQKRKPQGELMPPSNVLDRIDYWLKDQLREFPSKGELSIEEIEHWHQDLGRFPIAAIDWAFDSWRKSGRFFPVYGVILDYCAAWEPPQASQHVPGCSKECAARHGRGYHMNDVRWLYRAYVKKREEVNGPLNEPEIELLLGALDKKRGKPPDWRKSQ
jgi:hypothetical protein